MADCMEDYPTTKKTEITNKPLSKPGNSWITRLCSVFEQSPNYSSKFTRNSSLLPFFRLPGTEDRVVIYYTSLGGIRRTFNDCHDTRVIFQSLHVNLDERDISMDAAYKVELQRVLGETNVSLPQVFIKGKYIGGSDVIGRLHEDGELAKLVEGIPLRASRSCDNCDDVRFVPCASCNGSRKVFDEEDGHHKRCFVCNENGLVRCKFCCS